VKIKDFNNEMAMNRIAELNVIANQFGWKNININVASKLTSYAKMIEEGACRIDVYYTTMTVSISLNHPKKGKTQLHRKHVTDKELEILFKNPRSHTGKGYYNQKGIPVPYRKGVLKRG
jgi:hypothetical protein